MTKITPYLSNQSFLQLLSDAIHFAKLSKEAGENYQSQRFARTSILHSIMSIEAAANACIANIDGAYNFTNDIDNYLQFPSLMFIRNLTDQGLLTEVLTNISKYRN